MTKLNENITSKNMENLGKLCSKEFITLNAYIKQKEKSKINNLSFYLRKVEKEEKIKFQSKQKKHNSKNLHRHQ